ncbi:MAG: tetratricopeptide repeat protein [Alphaproteobacteria bacterium]|nr:MAG: tetratricopeptide repeat protein [Alphaproteobacteria bacterium]
MRHQAPRLSLSRWIIAGVGVFALYACATDTQYGAPTSRMNDASKLDVVETHYGNYLAARQAMIENDQSAAAAFYKRTLKEDPDNQIIRERAFLLELSSGNFERALAHAEILVASRPTNRLARMVLATNEIRQKGYVRARAQMDQSAMGLYNALAVDLLRAWTYAGEKDIEAAERALTGLRAFGSGELLAAYHLALIYDNGGDAAAAEQKYLDALEMGGRTSTRIVEAFGNYLERQKRGSEAVALYDEYLELQPNNPEIRASRERALKGRVPQAFISSIEVGAAEAYLSVAGFLDTDRTADLSIAYLHLALALEEDFPIANLILGELQKQRQNYSSAIEYYAKVPLSDPLGPQAAIQIAASLQQLDRGDEAIWTLNNLVKRRPEDFLARVSLADSYRTQGKFDLAVDSYTKALELQKAEGDEAAWFVFYSRGMSYYQIGEVTKAESDFLQALDITPEQPLVLNSLGYSWVERNYRVPDALALLEKAAELSPNNGYIIDSLGWAHYQLGNYELATKYLELAVELAPEDAELHDHLGDAYWKAGRYLEAGFEWHHALKLDPSPERVAAIEEKLERRSKVIPNS